MTGTKTHQKLEGSRREVWIGTAQKTTGGLEKSDLIKVGGRLKSKSKSLLSKERFQSRTKSRSRSRSRSRSTSIPIGRRDSKNTKSKK